MEFVVFELCPREEHCNVCGKIHHMKYFLPMFNGQIVNPDKTDEWAGFPVCESCYINYKSEEVSHEKIKNIVIV